MTNEDICKEMRLLKKGTRQEINYLYMSWQVADAINDALIIDCYSSMPDLIIGQEFAWRTENE